jgi:hypothetical protein
VLPWKNLDKLEAMIGGDLDGKTFSAFADENYPKRLAWPGFHEGLEFLDNGHRTGPIGIELRIA